jgi:hypothetical protein
MEYLFIYIFASLIFRGRNGNPNNPVVILRPRLSLYLTHKASGPDNISGRILKDLQNLTAPILTIIFQKSLQTGCILFNWQRTVVEFHRI